MPRHSRRQADAAMRSAKSRNIACVHSIAAVESHEVRHPGAIEMSICGLCVFAHINVGFDHLAPVIEIVAKFTRDMGLVLFDYMITTRPRVAASLSSGNCAFPNQPAAPVKVGTLFVDVDDDLGSAR